MRRWWDGEGKDGEVSESGREGRLHVGRMGDGPRIVGDADGPSPWCAPGGWIASKFGNPPYPEATTRPSPTTRGRKR
eukprot:4296607-Pyramimonas_sp.AAC.1